MYRRALRPCSVKKMNKSTMISHIITIGQQFCRNFDGVEMVKLAIDPSADNPQALQEFFSMGQ
jgi:hypothetical protein